MWGWSTAVGPLSTIATACAAGTQAIGDAAELIRRGVTDVMLTGGAEAQIGLLFFAGFSAMKVLTLQNDCRARQRAVRSRRDGFVIGEGAAIFVLEELEHAQRRGARIYAEILGQAVSADAYHAVIPDATGMGPVCAMRWALADAGVAPEPVDYINVHGSATQANDAAETAAIKRLFGDHAYNLCVNSTKSMIGHAFRVAGAIEALATIQAVYTNTIHPTINLRTPDPVCDLDYVPNVARRKPVNVAMSNSFGLGGQKPAWCSPKTTSEGVFIHARYNQPENDQAARPPGDDRQPGGDRRAGARHARIFPAAFRVGFVGRPGAGVSARPVRHLQPAALGVLTPARRGACRRDEGL